MSYADTQLDLSGLPVACLTGPNGAGKSALLDAVTWALWEEGRASSDELMRLGEREMWVEVVFIHEGRLYRVRRSRQRPAKSGKGASKGTLEFMIAENFNEASPPELSLVKWNSLTSASMKETGKHISDLLRMDFDTFINSAYLKQGRAEEFTLRAPSERKQVLCEILGLSYFDRLQDEARERLKFLRAKMEFLEGTVMQSEALQGKAAQVEEELQAARLRFDDLQATAGDIETRVRELTEKVQSLKVMAVTISSNEGRLADLRSQSERLSLERDSLIDKQTNLKALIAGGAALERDLLEFEAVRAQVEKLDGLQNTVQDLVEKKIAYSSELSNARSHLELNIEQLEKEKKDLNLRLEELQGETRDSDKIIAQYNEYKQMLTMEAKLAAKLEAFNQLSHRSAELSALVQEHKIRLDAELDQRERALRELATVSQSDNALVSEGEKLDLEALELDKMEAEFEICEKRGIAIKASVEAFELKVEDLKVRQNENLEKIRELKSHAHSSICPLCSAPIVDRAAVIDRYLKHNDEMNDEIANIQAQKESLLGERDELRRSYVELKRALSGRKELDKRIGQLNERQRAVTKAKETINKLEAEAQDLRHKIEQNNYAQVERESLISVKAELAKIDFDPAVFASLQSQIRLKRHLESKREQLDKDMRELTLSGERLPRLEAELGRLKSELASESYGSEIRARLSSVVSQIEGHAYNRDEHGRLKQRLAELFSVAQKAADVRRSMQELPELERRVLEIASELARLTQLTDELAAAQAALKVDLAGLDSAQSALLGLSPLLEETLKERQEAASNLAVLSEKKASIERELGAISERLDEIASLKEEVEDYGYLVEVLGKKGIQAVIIENAIPEIEGEANRILSRLTDNKMHVALITQAKTKSGTMSETLDLVIGDDIGTRNYELYSGGEAFKVNFALRIALSRLLARRSGAKLETLIIDEGFGSQDDASRDKLVKAIRLIQAEFSRILVITHIADVREMFPVQIQVHKKGGISSLKMIS